ncbi:MAG TPA: hypothetical protein VIV57_18290 [Anaeromyxobacter sp.]
MSAFRMLFLSVAGVVLLGIGLTGFETVHWVLYLPVGFLTFAGLTGVCPGLIFWRKLGFSDEPVSCELPGKKKRRP